MPVSRKIIKLTALALKDRVLTNVEKQTIIETAIKEGTPKDEITEYLENALKERLKTYTKDELKQCPHCGAQIPLISDDCIFCGESLKKNGKTAQTHWPTGREFAIINAENAKTAEQKRNIKHCPDCGAPYPLLSNICSSCGHILHAPTDSEYNIDNLIKKLDENLNQLKKYPSFVPWLLMLILRFLPTIVFISIALDDLKVPLPFSIFDIQIPNSIKDIIAIYIILAAIMEMIVLNHVPRFVDIKFNEALHMAKTYLNKIRSLYGEAKEAECLIKNAEIKISKIRKKHTVQLVISTMLLILTMAGGVGYQYKKDYDAYIQTHNADSIYNKLTAVKPLYYKSTGYVLEDESLCIGNNFHIYIETIFGVRGSSPKFGLRIDNVKIMPTGKSFANKPSNTFVGKGNDWFTYQFTYPTEERFPSYSAIIITDENDNGIDLVMTEDLYKNDDDFPSFSNRVHRNPNNTSNCYYANFRSKHKYSRIEEAIDALKSIKTIKIQLKADSHGR